MSQEVILIKEEVVVIDGEVVLDIVDIEEYGRKNEKPPRAKHYRIRIDKEYYEVSVPHMTGRQLLELAGKRPADKWQINEKTHGGQVRKMGLDEEADFTRHGTERFMTLPLDQTEG